MKKKRSLVVPFLVLCGLVVAALLTYFVMMETGKVHVVKELADGSVYSGYWRFGEPYGEGFLATRSGKLYDGVWDDEGHLTHGRMITHEFTYLGGLNNYLPNGYGSCKYVDGSSYYGFFRNGYKNGLGKFEKGDSLRFGEWQMGKLNYPKGQRYRPGQQVYGIDVSNHQYKIDWERLTLYADSMGVVTGNLKSSPYLQPVLFALVKSTEGQDFQTETFERNYKESKRCGIVTGAYHFLRLSDIDGQIKNFIDHTPLVKGDLPPVLDMELDNRTMKKEHAKAVAYAHKWLEAMEKHYGVRPMLYTYDSYYNSYLKGQGFDKYDFFIARYNPETMPRVPHLEIWQYSEDGNAGGIKTSVDLDYFMDNYTAFRQYVAEKGIQ